MCDVTSNIHSLSVGESQRQAEACRTLVTSPWARSFKLTWSSFSYFLTPLMLHILPMSQMP